MSFRQGCAEAFIFGGVIGEETPCRHGTVKPAREDRPEIGFEAGGARLRGYGNFQGRYSCGFFSSAAAFFNNQVMYSKGLTPAN